MAPPPSLKLIFFLHYFLCLCLSRELRTYIVQLHPHMPGGDGGEFESRHHWHLSFLEKTIVLREGDDPSSRLLYSYNVAIEGFSARLSDEEVDALRHMPGVIAVRPDLRVELHTTYSYKFLGLGHSRNGAWDRSIFGTGTVVGVLDTGVWPESPSFRDDTMQPVPRRWKGVCQVGESFNSSSCNRKLIGARFYSKGHWSSPSMPSPPPSATEYVSPRDAHGHGTHTSSTAAGTTVRGASVLGIGTGDARGMAPGAHIAVYKVCWYNGCYSSDILAGMDDAITDGVDILSLSLGGFPLPLFEDSIAIGGFRAIERGVMVVCAAGNNGPVPYSVANEAPWITTVGASTLDRRFPAFLRLGNGQLIYGESVYPGNHFSKNNRGVELELFYETGGNRGAEFCFKGSLSKALVGGKMVVCDRGVNGRAEKGEAVKEASGVAMVLANAEINQEEDSVDPHVLPATVIGYRESLKLKEYMNSTKKPVARIEFGGTRVHKSRAPAVALFSARGPSLTIPSILKPDIIAPGVNIIAAWPQNLGPSGLEEDTRRSDFSILSGTSMACPHVTGVAALIRSVHRSWSPAMIKSAIMTTADVLDHYGKPIMEGDKPAGVLAMGAGQINPARAVDPGLVYDIKPEDYITQLCTLGYTQSQIFTITHRNTTCHEFLQKTKSFSLNYPSISVIFNHGSTRFTVQRTLTNVGLPNSTYTAKAAAMPGVRMRVVPQSLTFSDVNQSKSYRVWFQTRKKEMKGMVSFAEGHLTWVHSNHENYRVRSPISVTWQG